MPKVIIKKGAENLFSAPFFYLIIFGHTQVAKVMVGIDSTSGDWNKAFYFIAATCVVGMILWFFTKPPVKPETTD